MINKRLILVFFCICVCFPFLSSTQQLWAKDFTLVIDPGHGGKDPGAVGRISKEKDINLRVALKLGKLIQERCPDVDVVFTRKRDVFVQLQRRAQIANDKKADLFISIHTNAVARGRRVRGASTWTLGLAKSRDNLNVAKRENAVILYESDYKTRYAGFNPNSSESYIIFEFMQDRYMQQSVHLASLVQKEFKTNSKRVDRGVHQAGFLVLKASAMPSILVELGFISNRTEERYLNSSRGVNSLSESIYRAFLKYKHEHEAKLKRLAQRSNNVNTAKVVAKKVIPKKDKVVSSSPNRSNLTFKVQFLTSKRRLSQRDRKLKGLSAVEYYQSNGWYKYTCFKTTNLDRANSSLRKVRKRYKDAFLVAFKGKERVNIHKAIEEYKNR